MTLLELLNTTRDLIPDDVVPDSTTLLSLMNRAYKQIAQRTQCIHDTILSPIVNDTITVPPYVISILTAKYKQAGADTINLQVLHWADASGRFGDKYVQSPPLGRPVALAVFGHELIKVLPKPSGGGTVESVCSVIPHTLGKVKPLLADTDEPSLPDSDQDVLAYYTAVLVLASYPVYRQVLDNYSRLALEKMNTIMQANEVLASHPVGLSPTASMSVPIIRTYWTGGR